VAEWIAANVRRLRDAHGWTQEDLAERAGVDVRTLQDLEAARHDALEITVWAVAEALKARIGELFLKARFRPAKPGRPRRK
jgi:transcriptional regulator with XRE-family HTH domain